MIFRIFFLAFTGEIRHFDQPLEDKAALTNFFSQWIEKGYVFVDHADAKIVVPWTNFATAVEVGEGADSLG